MPFFPLQFCNLGNCVVIYTYKLLLSCIPLLRLSVYLAVMFIKLLFPITILMIASFCVKIISLSPAMWQCLFRKAVCMLSNCHKVDERFILDPPPAWPCCLQILLKYRVLEAKASC